MRRIPPVVSVFVGGFVFYLLPAGAFGTHDVAIRAIICGATTAATAELILLVRKKSSEPTS